MTTTKNITLILSFILVSITIFFAYSLLNNILMLVSQDMHKFSINETIIIEIPDSENTTTMYFMFKAYQNDLDYLIYDDGDVTKVEMDEPGDLISYALIDIEITNQETNEVLYINSMPSNTTVTINNYEAIGKITFPPGTYTVTASVSEGTMFLGGFGFSNTNILKFVLLLIGSIIGFLVSGAGFIVTFTRFLKTRSNPITETYSSNNQYDFDKNHFDEDDPFSKYD